ncbi:hypothetical protein [Streptomyces sp. NBC_01716]|uniref:hypothetical protein n=1 Tax=Streptomyces sp. NBC_01716 TaxID=2975917 RepID=UPI002E338A41|nr:hypothetical protein [Streptomyces sp. NBC_01716]
MTAHPLTAPAPDTDGLASAFRERGLRQALVQLRSVGSAPDAASMGAVVLGYRLVWQVTGRWIDLPRQRLQECSDSPSDTARWQHLIGTVQSPADGSIAGATYEGLLVLVGQARDLLRVRAGRLTGDDPPPRRTPGPAPAGRPAVRARVGDMALFDLGIRYPLIYISASTFFLLTSQQAQVSCFRSAARHLTPDGRLVIEAAVPHTSGMAAERQQMIVREMSEHHLKWSAFVHDPVAQTVHAQEVRIGPNGYRLLPNVMRYAFPSELDLMAQLAGLRLERRTANWDDSPFTTTSTHHVSLYSHQPADRDAPSPAGDTA